jgi:L-serine dehydratase
MKKSIDITATEKENIEFSADSELFCKISKLFYKKPKEHGSRFLHEQLLKLKFNPQNIFKTKSRDKDLIIHSYDIKKLHNSIIELNLPSDVSKGLYTIFVDPVEDISVINLNKAIESTYLGSRIRIPDFERIKSSFFGKNNEIKTSVDISISTISGKSIIKISCINTSKNTLVDNLIETLHRHFATPDHLFLWEFKNPDKKVDNFFRAELFFNSTISAKIFKSIHDDFKRYLFTYIRPLSIFDMVGPAMVGPSSSHTAGANKIGQIARNIIEAIDEKETEEIISIEVVLLGSFRDTGVGHRTPLAIGAGLCGIHEDDPLMIRFGDPEYLLKTGVKIKNTYVNFVGYRKGSPAEDKKYSNEKNNNIAEVIVTTTISTYHITGFSIGGGNVEIRYINSKLDNPINGKTDMYLNGIQAVPTSKNNNLPLIRKIEKGSFDFDQNINIPFNSMQELAEYLDNTEKDMLEAVLNTEMELQRIEKNEVYSKMSGYWQIMEKSIILGLKDKKESLLKLTGQDSQKIDKYVKDSAIFNNIFGKAVAYATAVNEINAKSGLIIACPTAGSCGIIPGILKAYSEVTDVKTEKLLESLMIAGFLGMIMFNDVTTAGADYGCQAEIGAGAAMAASALAYLGGGTTDMIIQAFTLTLKNCLGLTCDPVAGLVEIPCVKRNGLYTSIAISSALMALSGVRSFIAVDEVIITLKEVGEKLSCDYKETARGGLAQTRDGKEVERLFEKEVERFFNKD